MENNRFRRLTIIDYALIGVFCAAAGYVYIGFFYSDPHIGPKARMLLGAVRIGVPLIIAAGILLYYYTRTGRLPVVSLLVAGISMLLCVLLASPVALIVYYGKNRHAVSDTYHPFLQLAPPDIQNEKEEAGDNTIKIFCLGGSTTEFTDSGKRGWPDRLETLLDEKIPDKAFAVYNMGRQWYTTQHSLINYAVNLRHRTPDIIIVMHAINDLLVNADFCRFSSDEFHEDYRHFHGPICRMVMQEGIAHAFMRVVRTMWYYRPREIVVTKRFPGLVPFKRNLQTIIALAAADNATVVLMTQPTLIKSDMSPEEEAALYMLHHEAVGPEKKWAMETAVNGMEAYNKTVRELARQEHVLLIDLERAVPKSLEYFNDDVHFQDKTFDIIAGTIADRISVLLR